MKKLEKLIRRQGQSKQAFVENAVLAEMAALEERQARAREPAPSSFSSNLNNTESFGMGLMERMKERDQRGSREAQPIPQNQGQVVVNVGTNNGNRSNNADNMIDGLAAYVVSGRDFEQTHRLRAVVSILQDSTQNEEERRVLAARLDEAIATKKKAQGGDTNNESPIRIARVAFDKLADLLR
jgi:hypothetical protein